MEFVDWVGFIGVTILLVAYFLNLTNKIDKESLTYSSLNVIGGGIACTASIILNYLPFIILETAWTLVSVVAFVSALKKKR
jgi:hypothetical protein